MGTSIDSAKLVRKLVVTSRRRCREKELNVD